MGSSWRQASVGALAPQGPLAGVAIAADGFLVLSDDNMSEGAPLAPPTNTWWLDVSYSNWSQLAANGPLTRSGACMAPLE